MRRIRVSAQSVARSVAGAIAGFVREGEFELVIETMGAGALNQAVKGIIIARGLLTPAGVELVMQPERVPLKRGKREIEMIRLYLEARGAREAFGPTGKGKKGKEPIQEIRHFVTGSFQSHAVHLDDEDYGRVLDNVVIACVDCLVVNSRGEMLLGKRAIEPQLDWWIVGGRMRPGESFGVAAARTLKCELGLVIEPVRFRYLDTYSLVWARRAQPPQEHGSHNVVIVMVVHIDDIEAAAIRPSGEYERVQWVQPAVVVDETGFHPALRKYAQDLLAFWERGTS